MVNKADVFVAYLAKNASTTESVVVADKITPEVMEFADVDIPVDEKPPLVVKTWGKIGETASGFAKKISFGGLGKMLGKTLEKTRMGTMVITDKRVYWARLRPDTAAAGITGIVGKINGSCAFDDLAQVAIGEHDHCLGNAYMGHQLVINNQVVGLLRMGFGIEFDERAIDYLNKMFDACVNK